MSSLRRDFSSFAARLPARSPRFAIMVVLILAVGIASNTVIFSTVQSVFLRPLPYPDADRSSTGVQSATLWGPSMLGRATWGYIAYPEGRSTDDPD